MVNKHFNRDSRCYILDAADTVLGCYFGFDRTVYEKPKNNGKKGNGIINCMKKEQKIFKQR
jgi:hypothetical protein